MRLYKTVLQMVLASMTALGTVSIEQMGRSELCVRIHTGLLHLLNGVCERKVEHRESPMV